MDHKMGPALQFKSFDGMNHIGKAAMENNLDMLQNVLIFCGGHEAVNAKYEGSTALYYAVTNGNARMVQLLLQAGANPNIPSTRSTALLCAVHHGNLQLVRMLVRAGAKINTSHPLLMPYDTERWTPLQLAIKRGCFNIVKTLVNHGARLDFIGDSNKYTAFDLSLTCRNLEIATFFIKNGGARKPSYCYKRRGARQSEIGKSIVFVFLEFHEYSEEFISAILHLLHKSGYRILKDPFLRHLLQQKESLTPVLDRTGHCLGTELSDFDYLVTIMNRYTDPDFKELFRNPLRSSCVVYSPVHGDEEAHITKKARIIREMIESCRVVDRLSSLCRIRIRNRLSSVCQRRALKYLVPQLPLPTLFINYLMLEEG